MGLKGKELKKQIEEQELFVKKMCWRMQEQFGKDSGGSYAIAEAIGRLTLLMLLDK